MSKTKIKSFENVAFILLIPPNLLHIKDAIFVAIVNFSYYICYRG